MKNKPFPLYVALSALLSLVSIYGLGRAKVANAADEKPPIRVSDYASAKDLVAAQKYFLSQLEEPLASKMDYAEDTQERVKKNALVLAVLTMHLGLHDTANPAQASAAEIYPVAIELAAKVKDYDQTKAAYEKLQASFDNSIKATQPLTWGMVRGQGALMKKTNELNSAIKRNLTPARFEKQLESLKYQTATMAALGQATFLDKHHVKDPAEHPTYEKYAVEFRTAAAELNKAVHAADQAAAIKAFARMDTSCHTCHQKFDPPKK
jgi:hypothetical protein